MKKWLQYTISCIAICLASNVQAEIINLTLYWHSGICGAQCARALDNNLQKVRGVSQVQTEFNDGYAILTWKPRLALDYSQILLATQRVGVSMDEVRLKMRGTISHSGQRFFIQSLGDPTKVELFSFQQPSTTRFVDFTNISSFSVNPDLQRKLLDAEKGNQLVTVEGRLFEPEVPPLKLIVDNFSIDNAVQDTNQSEPASTRPSTRTNNFQQGRIPNSPRGIVQ